MKRLDNALTALVPTPFSPTLNWNTSSLYLAPVLMRETHSTILPSGMPRPWSRNQDIGAVDRDEHLAAVAHDELVYRVVDDLLEQDINTVVVMAAVADPADVHAGPRPDVFQGRKRLDFALVVNVRFGRISGHYEWR